MKVLTDTHSLVWALSDPASLSSKARKVMSQSEVTASVANLWELVLKVGKRDCLLADPLRWWERYVLKTGIHMLPIRSEHVMALGYLPPLHKDPFDRILVAQSASENLPLVTKDAYLKDYGIATIW